MSAVAIAARPAPSRQPASAPSRHLEIAPSRAQRRARPRVVYALATIAGIGVILLAQLLLSIVLADGAYRISELQTAQRDLVRQQHALTEELQVWSSTQNLAANAKELGMVASGNPVFLNLENGHVSGHGSAAGSGGIGSHKNLVDNALLDPSMVIDPEHQTDPDHQTGTVDADPVTASTAPPTTPTQPGMLPSPTTR